MRLKLRLSKVIKCENINENTIGVAYEMLETLAGSQVRSDEEVSDVFVALR